VTGGAATVVVAHPTSAQYVVAYALSLCVKLMRSYASAPRGKFGFSGRRDPDPRDDDCLHSSFCGEWRAGALTTGCRNVGQLLKSVLRCECDHHNKKLNADK